MSESTSIPVNIDNFVHAETSLQFENMMKMSRGVNKFAHARRPLRLDRQTVLRMNRDTLYSSAVVDISKGATITLPNAGGRYMSVAVLNEDNYTTAVFHTPGSYELTQAEHESAFVVLIARIIVNPNDVEDIRAVNEIQDQLEIIAASENTFSRPNYDVESHQTTSGLLVQLGEGLRDAEFTNGTKDQVKETRHMVCTAFGWGGLPTSEVIYGVGDSLPLGQYQLTVKDVPVDAFWSISIYNKEGFFEENEFNSYNINNVMAEPNEDGSFTVNFGDCASGLKNCLHIMDGWSYGVRLYLPREEIRSGSWKFPVPRKVNN